MRLIDADALKENLIQFFQEEALEGITFKTGFKQILTYIENEHTIDAVDAVHCRECKHWVFYPSIGCTDHVKVCDYAKYMVHENGYCVYGERVTNATD